MGLMPQEYKHVYLWLRSQELGQTVILVFPVGGWGESFIQAQDMFLWHMDRRIGTADESIRSLCQEEEDLKWESVDLQKRLREASTSQDLK